ncbi:hypothetical protein [Armatimonas rosea]|uniref:Uncharacterized protein n=1 Tax=Armatimonas rosea TaxID=685828 RepID=A0A7W9SUV2_ARMRO|nr:hypothetical protein [Armatimonas rosea]MBB6053277.1 hypothetical protein [Armatimonas rosea]
MAKGTWSALGTVTTVLSTGLNSLASNASAISNSYTTSGWMLARVTLTISYAVAPTANTSIDLFAIQSSDGGTTWSDGSGSVTPTAGLIKSFGLRAVTGAQVLVDTVMIPPGPIKFLARSNGVGQTAAASGNTITIETVTVDMT